jgi:hypothetical protein
MKTLRLDDLMLLVLGATAVALTVLAMSYTNTYEVKAKEAHHVEQPNVITEEQCIPADYAHVKYPDDFEFYCIGSTIEIWTNEGEYVTSEIRGTYVMAEDGSYVPADFWNTEEATK